MKISIITLHRFDNVGSCLQACALSNYLASKSHNTLLLDYTPFYKEYYEIPKLAAKIINRRNLKKRMKKIDLTLKEYSNLSERFYNKKKIGKYVSNCDLLISGGDQIWNPMYPNYYDGAYYYDGISNKRKIAYGSSVSVNSLTENQIQYLKEKIHGYESVNVREKRTAEIFIENNINPNTRYIVDPVFLPNRNLYDEMVAKSDIKINEDYILIYHVDKGENLNKIINQLQEKLGYKIISLIGNRKYWYSDMYIKDYGPYDFLNLIKNAKVVLTGSFHALCFSLIFKKNFMIQLPIDSPNRIKNILSEVNLTDRIIKETNDVEKIYSRRISNESYDILQEKIVESRKILDASINGETK